MTLQCNADALVVSHSTSVEVEVEIFLVLLRKHNDSTILFNLFISQSVQRHKTNKQHLKPISPIIIPPFQITIKSRYTYINNHTSCFVWE